MVYLINFIINLMAFCVSTFWLMDFMDMPFMEIFDTDIPLNGWFWVAFALLFIITIGGCLSDMDKLIAKLRKN